MEGKSNEEKVQYILNLASATKNFFCEYYGMGQTIDGQNIDSPDQLVNQVYAIPVALIDKSHSHACR